MVDSLDSAGDRDIVRLRRPATPRSSSSLVSLRMQVRTRRYPAQHRPSETGNHSDCLHKHRMLQNRLFPLTRANQLSWPICSTEYSLTTTKTTSSLFHL